MLACDVFFGWYVVDWCLFRLGVEFPRTILVFGFAFGFCVLGVGAFQGLVLG